MAAFATGTKNMIMKYPNPKSSWKHIPTYIHTYTEFTKCWVHYESWKGHH